VRHHFDLPQKHTDVGDFFKDALAEELSPSSHYLLAELLSVQSLKWCASSTDCFFTLCRVGEEKLSHKR